MLELDRLYNMDCMIGMKELPDKFFDIAIVDPPYGINVTHKGEIGGSVLANTTRFKKKPWDITPPDRNISRSYSEFPDIKLFGAQITLSAVFLLIARAGLFGINRMERRTLPIVN